MSEVATEKSRLSADIDLIMIDKDLGFADLIKISCWSSHELNLYCNGRLSAFSVIDLQTVKALLEAK